MITWPPIEDPALHERLTLDDDAFRAYLRGFVGNLPVGRECDHVALARAFGYPWRRPERSYLLRADHSVALLEDHDAASERRALLVRFSGPAAGRVPLLAIGSNGAPGALRTKFGHFADEADREVLVLAGHLHGFDVGAAAQPTIYGSMPATLFESPGTAVRTAVLWLTPAQFVQLVWSELTYRLGHIDARFEADEPGFDVEGVLAFVSRFPVYAEDGERVALAAVPARGRTTPARTQRELMAAAARVVLDHPSATAEDLVRAIYDDIAPLLERYPRLHTRGVPFRSSRWTPYPG